MIDVKIREKEIGMTGHALHSVNGQDIVCAAVSALTCNLINSIENLTEAKIRAETSSGRTRIEFLTIDEQAKLLVDSWNLGLVAVDQNYHCIHYV